MKNKITEENILTEHKEELQKGIILMRLDERHLNRQKITAKEGELGEIENVIRQKKAQIKGYESRIELIDDIIEEAEKAATK